MPIHYASHSPQYSLQLVDLTMTITTRQMIVGHPHRLHEGVTDRRTHKLEAAHLQVFAHGVRFRCCDGQISRSRPAITNRLATNELPQISVETAKFFRHLSVAVCTGWIALGRAGTGLGRVIGRSSTESACRESRPTELVRPASRISRPPGQRRPQG